MEHLLKLNEELQKKSSIYDNDLTEEKWLAKNKKLIRYNLRFLESPDFSKRCPNAYKLIAWRLDYLHILLSIFYDSLNYGCRLEKSQLPLFWISYIKLQKEWQCRSDKVATTLLLFNMLGLIYKINDNFVNKKILTEAKKYQAEKKYKKHCNFYYVPRYSKKLFQEIEKRAIKLKENNIKLKSLKKEWVLRTFGKEIANVLFPQYVDENEDGTSKFTDYQTALLEQKVRSKIRKQKYILEKDLKSNPQWNISMNVILRRNKLIRIRATKDIKSAFNIDSNGSPYIICKKFNKK